MAKNGFSTVDCDIHPALQDLNVLLPYVDDYWREQIVVRGISPLDIVSYPPRNPLTCRADWRPEKGNPGTSLELLRSHVLDGTGTDLAICNVVYGGQTVFNADFGAALCKAINTWISKEWLDKEPRLRASIVVPLQDPEQAVAEIERCAADPRFVQVLLPSTASMPLGQRYYWPIYRAAEKHGLPIGIHSAHNNRFAPTYVGWPTYFIEDYASHVQTFEGQLLSILYEGVFQKFPKLKVVLIESGVTWLMACMTRAETTWRSLRIEVPWVDRSPSEMIREHVRLTTQPFDAPTTPEEVEKILDHFGSDRMFLYSSDYPHWQYDGSDATPAGLPPALAQKIKHDNPAETYPRLMEPVQ
jgi:predicted TIM-barrel fold metal-dependent hydrolase